jgi:ABC-type multidrug transport system ATPase subunit
LLTPSQGPGSRGLAIEFQKIEKRYGARLALRGVSLSIASGECVALVGANGSGKTTLLRVAALLVRPSAGQVRFAEAKSGNADAPPPGKNRIGLVAHQTLLYDELTAEENLMLFARLYLLDRPAERAQAALDSAGLTSRGRDLVRTFSRGMRQRLAIARAILPSPALLLLDEPATGLDPSGQQWLAATLKQMSGAGCTMLMTTHGPGETRTLVTRAVRLAGGAVADDSGPTGDPTPLLQAALSPQGGI